MQAHKSRLCGPRKMHEHRFCKVLKHASFPFKSPEGSARPRYTSRDPESAESPSEGPAGSKCAGGGSARPGCPSTEPVRAKCLGACPNSRCSILSESDSSLSYEQVFSSLEYRSDTAAAAECAGLRAERPCLAVYR